MGGGAGVPVWLMGDVPTLGTWEPLQRPGLLLGAASKAGTLSSLQSPHQGLKPRRRKEGGKPRSGSLNEH